MKKAYIYPNSSNVKEHEVYNPYIIDFINSLSPYFEFVNHKNPTNGGVGILDVFKYLFRVDVIFLHWIEKVPERKGGLIQTLVLFFILFASMIFRYKVVWTMHNKFTHSGEKQKLTRMIFKSLLKRSYLVLTHSSQGIKFGESLVRGSSKKIVYFPHPVKDRRPSKSPQKDTDILIWGTIAPYKGIKKFLEFYTQNNLDKKYTLHIVGKATSTKYFNKIIPFQRKSIQIENDFISNEELSNLIHRSGIVLFTYSKNSILSSGVLMDSIGFGARILAPDVGAFSDLQKLDVVTTYKSFIDLPEVLDKEVSRSKIPDDTALDKFLINNSWNRYAENVIQQLKYSIR
ncbi:MAG: glycosyltransferase [Bacteroidales bacterium]